jgi:hypothetical protein
LFPPAFFVGGNDNFQIGEKEMKYKSICVLLLLGLAYFSLKGILFDCHFFSGKEELNFD